MEKRKVTFGEADRRYTELKRRHEAGNLSAQEFDEQLREMMVQDEEGRWWAKSRRTGEWNYHNGASWIKGTPPNYQPSAGESTAAKRTEAPQGVETPPSIAFLGQDLPVTFWRVGLVVVLVAVFWNVVVLIFPEYFASEASVGMMLAVTGFFTSFSLYYLPAFLVALDVESWYLALGRSISIALLGWVLYFWPTYFLWGAFIGDPTSPVSFVVGVVVIATFSAMVGSITFLISVLRYTMKRYIIIGIAAAFVASVVGTSFHHLLLTYVRGM